MAKKEKLGFKYSCAMPLMEAVRKLSYEKKVEACKEFHWMVNEEYSSECGMFIDRFEEVYHLIDFDDIYGDSCQYIGYCINDLDNAIHEIDYYNPMLFFEISEKLDKLM